MSIIHDALKKAGQQIADTEKKGVFIQNSGFRPELLRKKAQVNWGPIFVLLVLALITGPIIAPIFSSPFKHADSIVSQTSAGSPMPMTGAPAHMEAQFGVEEMPNSQAAISRPLNAVPNFLLSGVVVSSPDSYCLINGKVVKVGEGIDGAKLIAVSPEVVTLEYEGRQIRLAVD